MRKAILEQSVSWKLRCTLFAEMVSRQLSDPTKSCLPGIDQCAIYAALLEPFQVLERPLAVAYIGWADVVEDRDDDVIHLVLALQHLRQFPEAARAASVVPGDDWY